jgi:ribosomal protein S18 acetylase RimI-like enzyme
MIRPYEPGDQDALWELKQSFERELGTSTGDASKEAAYKGKLDEAYREQYLAWVRRCVEENPAVIQVAERDSTLDGYVFVLPESLAYIWDSAVLNEIYLREDSRGSSVADDLMEQALAVVREQSLPLDRVVLDVDQTNDRAQSFYERWGFEHWGEMVVREL